MLFWAFELLLLFKKINFKRKKKKKSGVDQERYGVRSPDLLLVNECCKAGSGIGCRGRRCTYLKLGSRWPIIVV